MGINQELIIVNYKILTKRLLETAKSVLNNNWELMYFILVIVVKQICFNLSINLLDPFNGDLIFANIGAALVLISLTILFKRKVRVTLLFLINLFVSLVLFSDQVYFRYFSDVISVPTVLRIGMIGSVKESVINLVSIRDIIWLPDIVIGLLLLIRLFFEQKQNSKSPRRVSRILACFLCAMSGLTMVYGPVKRLNQEQPGILTTFYDRTYVVQKLGDINFHSIDFVNFLSNLRTKDLSVQDQNRVINFFKNKNASTQSKYYGIAKGKNLIVIQVEALQEFVINRSLNGLDITPNLNNLVKKSLYFNNYYYQTGVGGTSDAEFLSNASLYPLNGEAVFYKYYNNKFESLPDIFRKNGYITIVMHAYKPSFWNRMNMYKSLGYDKFMHQGNYEIDDVVGMGLSDKSFFRQSLHKIEELKQPFIVSLITLSSHYPYWDTGKYGNFDVGEFEGSLLGNYLKAIHYTDEAIGEFLKGLERNGLLNNSVIAIYGDHQAIPESEKGNLAKLLGLEQIDLIAWKKLQKVPLIVYLPQVNIRGINHNLSGQIDFMPTLLNLFGLKSNWAMGKDILNNNDEFIVFKDGSFIKENTFYSANEGLAYNLNTNSQVVNNEMIKAKKMARDILNVSESIIRYDLLREIKN